MVKNNYPYFLDTFVGQLPVGESFDLVERRLSIGGRDGRMYFLDGLSDGQKGQLLLDFLMEISVREMKNIESADQFLASLVPFITATAESDVNMAAKQMYAGLAAILLDGLDKILIVDIRRYPLRGIEEPEKEKTLRGAKDGFNESIMSNIGLIRRRIRDNRLIFKYHMIGAKSKTDVAVCYMKGIVDDALLEKVTSALDNIKIDSISVGDQSIVEQLMKEFHRGRGGLASSFNPFPKVRYTQRPDVVCAHLTEGKIAIIVDNTPTVLLLPVGIFNFTQDMDDYYFPLITGNYLRLLRILNMVLILLATPVYLLTCEGHIEAPFDLDFILPKDDYALPVFWQFLLLELAIDALKLASLNTPNSLGMSLSVIGALILGEFSIDSGWFIAQTILVMAVVALASFTQPSMELSYGIKFIRVMLLIGCHLWGFWGFFGGLFLAFLMLVTTKTVSGHSYLFPLIPFYWPALKKLLFRTSR
ncbi:MAG: spore germination protein [Firmicutes bacterium]|nr:spore germination protein [Bacillota bacterium]